MRNINEISFIEFAETLMRIDGIQKDNPSLFAQMMGDICRECRLAAEMLYVIRKMNIHEEPSEEAILHHKVIMSVWLTLSGYKMPGITLH